MEDQDDTIGTRIHCPTFDGQVENFMTWWMRFENFAYNNDFEKGIGQVINPRMPSRHNTPLSNDLDIADEQEAAMKENKNAYAYLTACLRSSRDINIDCQSKPNAWP
jgi:glutathione S-transferase